jgi:hypothetical protein
MGPSVASSQNRSVIWAGAPRWGQGMVSGMGALLPSALVAVGGSLGGDFATSEDARCEGEQAVLWGT